MWDEVCFLKVRTIIKISKIAYITLMHLVLESAAAFKFPIRFTLKPATPRKGAKRVTCIVEERSGALT
jgi:hypothetical protein